MQITRPVMQRGSSVPGLLLPIGTPASQPEPLCCAGVVGLLDGFGDVGVVGCVDGFVEGFVVGLVLGAEVECGAEDELDVLDELDAAELLGAAAEVLVGTDVGVGAGALEEDEVELDAEEVFAATAAC